MKRYINEQSAETCKTDMLVLRHISRCPFLFLFFFLLNVTLVLRRYGFAFCRKLSAATYIFNHSCKRWGFTWLNNKNLKWALAELYKLLRARYMVLMCIIDFDAKETLMTRIKNLLARIRNCDIFINVIFLQLFIFFFFLGNFFWKIVIF